MNANQVAFVAFQEQDNLGVGYLGAVLTRAGFHIRIIDFRMAKEVIRENLKAAPPLVVGFSIIFQYHIQQFRDLIRYLRQNGVDCHFTAGGHYPSLRYQALMQFIPELDSIVLFEGEETLLELVQALSASKEWRGIQGLALRSADGEARANALRPLAEDLDQFPPPVRPPLKTYALGQKYATLIASRGCLYDCSYCSIREFYSKPAGKIKRYRRPERVTREMELLHHEKGCSLFMFQDDDFPVAGQQAKAWAYRFCDLLEQSGLSRSIMFKINCRPDEIDQALFKRLMSCGLFLAYIGLESGTDDGLRLMNKHTTAQTNLDAVTRLKAIDMLYDYGFMLFDPTSSFSSILANLDFLEKIGSDGSSPVTFCKMLPYAGTRIERLLAEQGRLQGAPGFMNYRFNDPGMDRLYDLVFDCFASWISNRDGLLNLATWVRYYLAVYRRYHQSDTALNQLEAGARKLIAESNGFIIETVRHLCRCLQMTNRYKMDDDETENLKTKVGNVQRQYETEMQQLIETIEHRAAGRIRS